MSKKLYRIIVSGWREFPPIGFCEDKLGKRIEYLRSLGWEVEVVVGDSYGVDLVVKDWCKLNKILCEQFKANWNKYGLSAGPRRNRAMVNYVMQAEEYELMAFPHRTSKGTKDMIEWCKHKKISTQIFEIL